MKGGRHRGALICGCMAHSGYGPMRCVDTAVTLLLTQVLGLRAAGRPHEYTGAATTFLSAIAAYGTSLERVRTCSSCKPVCVLQQHINAQTVLQGRPVFARHSVCAWETGTLHGGR